MSITTFMDCVSACANAPEFVAQFNRLLGCNLGQSKSLTPIERMIDAATGHKSESEADMGLFLAFVHYVVWSRLPMETVAAGDPIAFCVGRDAESLIDDRARQIGGLVAKL